MGQVGMPVPLMAAPHELARLLEQPDEQVDLGRAALLLARTEFPALDIQAELQRLDALAAQAAPYASPSEQPAGRVAGLCCFLGEICGFRGNEADYYDPRNSFLNLVLERRTGIPITLSVVYMEVGRRLGMPLYGIGLPGHFLVKYHDGRQTIFLDPFHGGRTINLRECRELVTRMYDGQVEFRGDFLAAVEKKYILLRMMNNLRNIYLQNRQYRKALTIVEMALAINPTSGEDLKHRGVLHYRLKNYKQSRLDLESYLFLNPDAPDAKDIRETLQELKKLVAMLN